MPKAKQRTQEELFPHSGFPYRLETKEDDGTRKGTKRIAWFQCEWHLTKHVERYRITEGTINVQEGHTLEVDPLKPKPKRTRKASGTKASKVSTTKKAIKPATKTKTTTRARKTTKKEAFSNLDTFFDS